VATAGLDLSEIAYPVRGIFRRRRTVRFILEHEALNAEPDADEVESLPGEASKGEVPVVLP